MPAPTTLPTLLRAGLCLCLALACLPMQGWAAPQQGESIPSLQLVAPDRAEDAAYLGLTGQQAVTLADFAGELFLIEIIGVYCPFCHQQVPTFNTLYARLTRAKLDGAVKMLAIASGATQPEIDFLRQQSGYTYPVLRDEDYALHKALGEPKTPFTMLVDRQGVVRYAHMGIVQDVDGLFATIKSLLPQ